MARLNDKGQIETYHIHNDMMEPVTLDDVVMGERAMNAFSIWREAEKALMEVTLDVAQGRRAPLNLADLIRNAR